MQRSHFVLKLLVHLVYDLVVIWPMANQKCHTKIVFFFEKKVVSHMTFGGQLTVLIYDDSLAVLDSIVM